MRSSTTPFATWTFTLAWDDDNDQYIVHTHQEDGDPIPADIAPTIGRLIATDLLRNATPPQTT